jgi:hypothetical protein
MPQPCQSPGQALPIFRMAISHWLRVRLQVQSNLCLLLLVLGSTCTLSVIGYSQENSIDKNSIRSPVASINSISVELSWSDATKKAASDAIAHDRTSDLSAVLLELLKYRDSQIRRDALEAVALIVPSRSILNQLKLLADRDPDSLCQAKSKLILAEHSDGRSHTEFQSGHPLDHSSIATAKKDQLTIKGRFPGKNEFPDALTGSRVNRALFQGRDAVDRSKIHAAEISDSVFEAGSASLTKFQTIDLPPTPRRQNSRFPEIEEPAEFDDDLEPGNELEPSLLDRPFSEPGDVFTEPVSADVWPVHASEAPLGYSGKSGILPVDSQEDGHFVPVPDRWRSGYSDWDRYDRKHPLGEDYPYKKGHWWDPYNLNALKGDYPIIGQHTFLRFTGQFSTNQEFRQIPTATTPFESTAKPNQQQFFGNNNQYFTTNFFRLSVDLFHGNTSFKPIDWNIRLTPVFDANYLATQQLGVVNPDVRKGKTRYDDFMALEEYFIEAKLKDLSPDYDFASMRIGSQQFTSDFRGFIFSDTNRAVRLFGTRLANRDQFNLLFFRQAEKDTNSQLNRFKDRDQNIVVANYYRQDFIFPGYTAQLSMHYNNDGPSFEFDHNDFLARPDPVGVYQPHRVESVYFGVAGDGHFGRFNVTNAFYWVTGRDSLNPIAGTSQNINAQMAAVELSYDRDWIRFRGSFFYASGDRNPYDHTAKGFDTILDNPNFAGGQFSYWQRQQLDLFGVGLVNRMSLVPDLRSSKFEGQSNFVNPGLHLFNLGVDFELTPKARVITNANYLEFDSTQVLQAFTFQNNINQTIGVDLSIGLEYRPLLSDNIILTGGYACLLPGAGFKDLFGTTSPFTTSNASTTSASLGVLSAAFMQAIFQF